MNVAMLLVRAGRAFGDRPALYAGRALLADYRTLARRAAAIAGALSARHGLVPGDRVALVMRNVPAYVEALFACWHGGFAAVPVNAKLHPKELAFILGDVGARLCFVTADLAESVAGLSPSLPALEAVIPVEAADYAALARGQPAPPVARAPDDLAWLFYTSGTTGRPKGAMLSHRNLLAMTLCYFADVDAILPTDCILHPAPMSHGSGMYILPHVAAAAAQVVPESGGFDPEEIVALIAAHPGATFFAAPTMVMRLVDDPAVRRADLGNLKTIVYGGGPMLAADCRGAMAVLGTRLAQIYGQGESPMTITALNKARHAETAHPRHAETAHPRHADRLASVGTAQTAVEVIVADADDRPLPPGEIGEVLVRGDTVMRGYWRNPDATAAALRGGWLHTGDVGVFDDDGFLSLKDRSKDLIISGGANVYPREVEEVLARHPDVAEVAVIGAPDRDWGEIVVACVVPVAGATLDPAALDALCLEHLARFKRPKRYVSLDALPKNNYGKVLKTALRQRPSTPEGR